MGESADLSAIDRQIVALINERYRLAGPGPELAPADLEEALLAQLAAANQGPLTETSLRAIYREVLSGQAALQRPRRVAYFGPENTFTHQAALKKFGHSVEARPLRTVADVFVEVEKGQVDYGVVPVENSTEGAVSMTFDLFPDTDVKICAEVHLAIHHHLMGRRPLAELSVVRSHPQVLAQCRNWLQSNARHCRIEEAPSSSTAAQLALTEDGAGAIGSALAAEALGLPLLASEIEDLASNVTRFLVVHRESPPPTGDDRTSILFAVKDRVGALYDALLPFKHHGVNLSMIHSRPSRRRSWDYYFYVDFLGHMDDEHPRAAVAELSEHCTFVKHLGSYPRATEPVA